MKKKIVFLLVVVLLLAGCGDGGLNAKSMEDRCRHDCDVLGYEYHHFNDLGYTGAYWDKNSCLCWSDGMETRQEAWKTRR